MFLRSQSRTPHRSPALQRRPSDTEPLVIASGSGTQDHTQSSPARTSLVNNLNSNGSCTYSDDDGDYDQQQSSSSCPNNMSHKHPHNLLNSNSNKLCHKRSTTSTFNTYSTAPTAPIASSSKVDVTNPFEDPSHIVNEPSPSGSSTPSTIPSDSSTPQSHPLYRTNPNSNSFHPHPHPPHAMHSNHGLDGTVSANAGFTAGTTDHSLPVPVTNKRAHTSTTISSRRSGRSTSSKLSRRVKKLPRAMRRVVKRFLRRVTGKSRKKEKMKVTWTAPQV
ncbi:hypothetical protein NEUTE1DRAFT_38912 [Neurospora tetrasperma FGSC 2508]|uniref:Uncharacterized protein n=1 Tax=Neurospora tetrasperma (strain FGSC 2508 / ATCC MYA-4615 / P0657) TaxID=510951 RepID=F8MHS8_NEUT8|nr:uncharacterized protein NEUTE1DRAFT_38912 [Neurospora tetrasperma FGSC 2508]EGO58837.1 hypothetical protein NEUTE1DRAFT_38912 [Neurospora tetrasperma FGSC 2508]EGZ72939.1 hypothetical protein NEUTE2DRAFT_127293 [Neurospora tetrasperma FGSC 2509]